MAKRALLIINPRSGDGENKRWVYDMVAGFSAVFDFVTVYLSKCRGDITRVAREEAGNYDALICCGGDGTLNETIRGILESGRDPMLGYIPTGTVNDFAASHGIPRSIKGAIEKLAAGEPHTYDIGTLGGVPFSYVAAFGAFTDVAYLTPQQSKIAFGKTAYVAEGMKRLLSLSPIRATVTGEDFSLAGEFLFGMAANSKTVFGFRFFEGSTKQSLSDGMLELLLVRYPKSPMEFQDAVMGLLNPKIQNDMVIRGRGREFSFVFPDGATPWTLDGEFGGDHSEVTASCLGGRIRVIE